MIKLGKVVTAPIIMVEKTNTIGIFNIVLENPELFDTQNLVIFEGYPKYKCNVSFVALRFGYYSSD